MTFPNSPRTIAIGDIHGCSCAFLTLLDAIDLRPQDTLVTLGDYVDRGIDSKGVLDRLIALQSRCNLVPILGNHDEMMLHSRNAKSDFQFWLNCGGDTCLDSYGSSSQLRLIPSAHFRFLESCCPYYETETHIFVHANYQVDVPLNQLDDHTLRWLSLRDYTPQIPHCSGKTFVLGHTPQDEILDLGYLIGIDTGCCSGGWLTAIEINTKQIWQVNEKGEFRKS